MTYVNFVGLWMSTINCRGDHGKAIQTPLECKEEIWILICRCAGNCSILHQKSTQALKKAIFLQESLGRELTGKTTLNCKTVSLVRPY